MKGNNDNGDGGANDNNNNQSVEPSADSDKSYTSPPRKKQCLIIPSKSDNEGLHGSEPDLVGGSLGACSKELTVQKQGVGETEKQPLVMVQDQMTEETDSDSDSDSDYGHRLVLDHSNEDREFARYARLPDNRKGLSHRP